MKKLFVLISLIFMCINVKAQDFKDFIITYNNDTIKCKIDVIQNGKIYYYVKEYKDITNYTGYKETRSIKKSAVYAYYWKGNLNPGTEIKHNDLNYNCMPNGTNQLLKINNVYVEQSYNNSSNSSTLWFGLFLTSAGGFLTAYSNVNLNNKMKSLEPLSKNYSDDVKKLTDNYYRNMYISCGMIGVGFIFDAIGINKLNKSKIRQEGDKVIITL